MSPPCNVDSKFPQVRCPAQVLKVDGHSIDDCGPVPHFDMALDDCSDEEGIEPGNSHIIEDDAWQAVDRLSKIYDSGVLPRMLSHVCADFEQKLRACAKREQDIEDALEKGDLERLSLHSGGKEMSSLDFMHPDLTTSDIRKLQTSANSDRQKMQDEVSAWERSLLTQQESVGGLGMQLEIAKLEEKCAEQKEKVSAKSRLIAELLDKDKMKQEGGRRKLLVDAGVCGAAALTAAGIARECAKLKRKRCRDREEAACEAAKAVLPDASLQEKVQEVLGAKSTLQSLQATATQYLSEREADAACKREELSATVALVEAARLQLSQRLCTCNEEEAVLIKADAEAFARLKRAGEELFEAARRYDELQARKAVLKLHAGDLQVKDQDLVGLIEEMQVAAADAEADCQALASQAAEAKEKLVRSIEEQEAWLDGAALGPTQAAVTNCLLSASLLDKMLQDGELEEQNVLAQIASLEEKGQAIEQDIDAESCEDAEELSAEFGKTMDEVFELQKKLSRWQDRLEGWRLQRRQVEALSDHFLGLGVRVQMDEVAQKGRDMAAAAYGDWPLRAAKSPTTSAIVAVDALSTTQTELQRVQTLVEKEVGRVLQQRRADMLVQERRFGVAR